MTHSVKYKIVECYEFVFLLNAFYQQQSLNCTCSDVLTDLEIFLMNYNLPAIEMLILTVVINIEKFKN